MLGGGCFWCTEAVFKELNGVLEVESGYSGGNVPYPSYEEVCTGNTGHAEVVKIAFDSAIISYRDILNVFFSIHDPTTLNRQGNDVGTQYRSVIFYTTEEQYKIAKELIDELIQKKYFKRPIVTAIEKFDSFYKAEEYHRNYFKNNSDKPYCQLVIAPKLEKFRDKFVTVLKYEK